MARLSKVKEERLKAEFLDRFLAADSEPPVTAQEFRKVRELLGFSQMGFAGRLGLNIRRIQSWEQGNHKPDGLISKFVRVLAKKPELLQAIPHL
jgi:DNA-binding transcriptional regulator YiaG